MAIGLGFSKAVTDGLIFGYDTGDRANSFKGQPTVNRFALPGTYGPGPGSDNNVGFQVQGTGTFVRLGWGQTIGDYYIKPEDVVYKYTLGSNGCHYHGNDVAIPSGTYATFTVDYYVTPDATGFPENSTLLVFESALSGAATVNSEVGVWRTITLTAGPTGGSGTLRMLLYPGGCGPRMASSGTLYMKNPRVEYRAYGTAFVDGERTATRSLLDVKQTYNLDVANMSFVSPGQFEFDGTDDYIQTNLAGTFSRITYEFIGFFDDPTLSTTSRNESAFGDWTNSRIHFGTRWSVGMHWNVNNGWTQIPTTNLRYGWNHYVLIYDNLNNQKLVYLNGILSNTETCNGDLVMGDFKIGVATSLGAFYRGKIQVFKVYNRPLAAAEVRQNYNLYRTRFSMG
jgi:hypothetical protein